MRRLIGKLEGRGPRPRRILGFEPLESRTMLSAAGMSLQTLPAPEPFAFSNPDFVDAAYVAEQSPTGRVAPIRSEGGPDAVDFSLAGEPGPETWQAMQVVVSRAELRLPFPMADGDMAVTTDRAQTGLRVSPLGEGVGIASGEFAPRIIGRWEFPDELSVDGMTDGLDALIDGANRREAAEFRQGDAVDFRHDPNLEGGFIVLGSPLQATFGARMDGIRTEQAPMMMLRESPPSAEANAMDGVHSFDTLPPEVSTASELQLQVGNLTPDATRNSTQSWAQEEGGLVASPGLNSTGATDATDGAAPSGIGVPAEPTREQLNAKALDDMGPHGDSALNGTLPSLTQSLFPSDFSELEKRAEDGPVDDETTMRTTPRPTRPTDRVESPESSADSRPASLLEAARDNSHDPPTATKGMPASPAQRALWALAREEGGTIDLVAAEMLRQERTEPAANLTGDRPSLGTQQIEVDKCVGLFQAFELSTVPAEELSEATLTALDDGPLPAPAEAGAPASNVIQPVQKVSEAVSKEPEGQSDRHAAALPSAIVALLLTAAGQAHLGRESAERRWRHPAN